MGEKKTVYKKNGRFVKQNTDGAIPYTVDTLGEEKTKEKSALQKKLKELREKGRIVKKIEKENEKAAKEADEFLKQGLSSSPVFSVPSNLGSPDDSILNAVLSASSPLNKGNSKSGPNTPTKSSPKKKINSPSKSQGSSPSKAAKTSGGRQDSPKPSASNAVQLCSPPKQLPSVESILPPLVGKHDQNNRLSRKKSVKIAEITSEDKFEEPKIRSV